MVGEDRPSAPDLTGTAAAKNDDSILQRRFVDVIELFFLSASTLFHHIIYTPADPAKGQPPSSANDLAVE